MDENHGNGKSPIYGDVHSKLIYGGRFMAIFTEVYPTKSPDLGGEFPSFVDPPMSVCLVDSQKKTLWFKVVPPR